MPTIDATVKGTTSNSYIANVRALVLLDESLNVSAFVDALPANQDRALMLATRIFEAGIAYKGYPTTTTQKLRMPQTGLMTLDGIPYSPDAIPECLERATAEFAAMLLIRDRVNEPESLGAGLREAKVGSIDVKFDHSEVLPVIPSYIYGLLVSIGRTNDAMARGSTMRQVKLVRG